MEHGLEIVGSQLLLSMVYIPLLFVNGYNVYALLKVRVQNKIFFCVHIFRGYVVDCTDRLKLDMLPSWARVNLSDMFMISYDIWAWDTRIIRTHYYRVHIIMAVC